MKTALIAVLLTSVSASMAQESPSAKPGKKSWQDEWTLPAWGIKTNLIYDATTTLNLGAEVRTTPKTSLELSMNWNPWQFRDDETKLRHILVQPEFRWWLLESFGGHFFGLHAHYAFYNIGGLPHGPFSQYMREHRFEGWLAGTGVSWGYRWNPYRHLGVEVTVGVGYAYLAYEKFECQRCGDNLGRETKHYFGPTKLGLSLIFGGGNKRKEYVAPPPVVIPEPEPLPVIVIPELYIPTFTAASFVTPEAEAVKARGETGKAYLDFTTGGVAIVPNYKNNAAELRKMKELIESVRTNPDATFTGISITGYASPDGDYAINLSVSERRVQSLKNYIGTNFGLSNIPISAHGTGEDWEGLDKLVEESDLPQREQILSIIRNVGVFEGRESQLMALEGGAVYRRMHNELFPQLRRVEYTLDYTVIPFTIEKGKEVMKTRPGDLSLNELFLIANTYRPGSDEYNEVFEITARAFPDNDVANLNAAAIVLNRKDAVSAAGYMARVKTRSAEYWNNLGLLQWLQGDITAAAQSFANAGALGAANAVELEKHAKTVAAKAAAEAELEARRANTNR